MSSVKKDINKFLKLLQRYRVAIAICVGVFIAFALNRLACPPSYRGLDECKFIGITIWSWFELLLGGPIALAVFGWWLGQWQKGRDDKKEKLLKKQEEAKEKEAILQNYFDRISELIVEKDIITKAKDCGEEDKEPSVVSSSRTLIEARTKSMLRRFTGDSERIRSVLEFLQAAELIEYIRPILSKLELAGVDLSFADLHKTNFRYADLHGTNLMEASLSGAIHSHTEASGALFSRLHFTTLTLLALTFP